MLLFLGGFASPGEEQGCMRVSERPRDGRTRRVATIAYHSSPLIEPGAGDAGGMTVYVRAVAAEHAAQGVYTDIFTRAVEPGSRITRVTPGVRVISIGAGPERPLPKEVLPDHIDEFVAGVGAFAALQRTAYDVVHSHYWQSGLAGLALSERWRAPLVHSQHTLGRVKNTFLPPGDAPESVRRIAGEDEVIGHADVLIGSTDEEWRQLSCLYGAPHDRLKVVYPGVDHARFKPGSRMRARARLGLRPDDAVVLYAGRIQPLKGVDVALGAIAQVADTLEREVVFVIVGGPSGAAGDHEVARLRALARDLGIGHRVRFEGPQPHRNLPSYYQAADALVVCSRSESFGLTALEAHACGIPIVATTVGGLTHVVRNGSSGWLVPDATPGAFAAKLHTLLTDDAGRPSFARAAVESARRFTWGRTAGELLELYDCLVASRVPELCTC
jgi:D-inositol-3-phosphate glycosyltransferase